MLDTPCDVYAAPFDVCLNAAGDDDMTVVQPDILVVCDRSKIDGKRCNGAPDLVIEILSPSTSGKDLLLKFNMYRKAGVREYWIVDHETKVVRVCVLKDGEYAITDHIAAGSVSVNILDGCTIDLRRIFAE